MRPVRILASIFLTITTFGCASQTLERVDYQSYTLGQVRSSSIGEAFLVDQDGTRETVKNWVGLMNSSDGWKVEQRYSADYVRKELLYAGMHDNVIEVSYREFRGGMAAPAFFQNLKYDLDESQTIRFQNFQIEVLEASNQEFKYRIIDD